MNRQLAEAFPPGDFLAEELEARHWSQNDFAEILGRPAQFVSEIISGKKEITRESAAQIGAAFNQSPELWLNLQNSYLLWRQGHDTATQDGLDLVRRRARLNALAPVALLRKRGFLSGSTVAELEQEIRALYDIDDLDQDPGFLAAARRTNRDEPTPTQKAWLACARRAARAVQVRTYNQEALRRLGEDLARFATDSAAFADLPLRYADAGIRLVYLEAFPGSKLDGTSFLLDDMSPVIALSGRGHRLDKVLFTLLHETAHVVLGHVRLDAFVIDEDGRCADPRERAADELALTWTFPRAVSQPPELVRRPWLEAEARRHGVHPVVVLGYLQKQGLIDWRTALAKGAPVVTDELGRWPSLAA